MSASSLLPSARASASKLGAALRALALRLRAISFPFLWMELEL
jgi:hypothetical protein